MKMKLKKSEHSTYITSVPCLMCAGEGKIDLLKMCDISIFNKRLKQQKQIKMHCKACNGKGYLLMKKLKRKNQLKPKENYVSQKTTQSEPII